MVAVLALALHMSLAGVPATSAPSDVADTLNRYLPKVWQTEDGLPQNAIQAITQTRDGYLWFGTPAGLVRFDGVRFTVFNQGQLQNNNIHALLEDRAGRLWIGTYGGGLYQYAAGRFVLFGPESGLQNKFIRTLYEARDGTIWVGTNGGAALYGADSRFHPLQSQDGLTSDTVRVIYDDPHGCVWIGTNAGGLNCWANNTVRGYALKAGRLTPYKAADAVSNDNVLAIVRDRHDRLWIGSDGGGLWQLQSDGVDRLVHQAAELNGVRRLFEDGAGNLWIGTDGRGLHRLRNQRLESFTSREGLPNDIVLDVFEDRERNMWVGTREGLLSLRRGKFLVYTTRDGLANDFVTALHQSRDGAMWVGTRLGLDRIEHGRAMPAAFSSRLPRDIVLSLLEDSAGVLWVGTRHGLYFIKSGRTRVLSTADGLRGNYVAALAQARGGGIWVGTRSGLDFVKDGRIGPAIAPLPIRADVTAIHESQDGTVWVGTDRAGVLQLEHGQWQQFGTADGLRHATVTAVADDAEDVWITTRQGLARITKGKMRRYTREHGLPSNQLFAVVDDGRGYVWLTSYVGIFRVAKQSFDDVDAGRRDHLALTAFDKNDGLKSSEPNNGGQPPVWHGTDGRVWFATVKGLAVIDPAHIPSNPQPPLVLIEQVRVDDTPVPLGDARMLPSGSKRVEFHYTALSFSSPSRVRFRYKLEGFDDAWIDAEARRVAYYTNIPPGNYRFRVTASNEDGVWSEAGAATTVVFGARFYQTALFWMGGVGVLGVAALGVYRLRVRRLEAQFAAVLAERTRIARDIHDTLAQSLVGIAVQLDTVAKMQPTRPEEAQQRLNRARILVRSSLAEARRSVWNLRSQALEDADLPEALQQIAEQLSGDHEVTVHVIGVRRRLPGDVEDNLLRIAQEALTNAVRHAQAQSISIDLKFGEGHVRLSVRDDGCGFDVESIARCGGHFGVAGIRERVHHLGGELSLTSQVGHGAEVVVEVAV
jgi:signal transduction histidine kinase/ligand-binding sensor domain-containing protein